MDYWAGNVTIIEKNQQRYRSNDSNKTLISTLVCTWLSCVQEQHILATRGIIYVSL